MKLSIMVSDRLVLQKMIDIIHNSLVEASAFKVKSDILIDFGEIPELVSVESSK